MSRKIKSKSHLDEGFRVLRTDFLIPDDIDLTIGGGEERILVSAALISQPVQSVISQLASRNLIDPLDFLRKPEVQISLVGGIIAERALGGSMHDHLLEKDFVANWQREGFDAALSSAEVNPVFRLIGRALVEKQLGFCRVYGLKCSSEVSKRAFEHLKALRYVLYASHWQVGTRGRLLNLNEWICALRPSVPPSKRSSIPKGGFFVRLPPARKKAGTDDLLLRGAREEDALSSGEKRFSPALLEARILEEDIKTGSDPEELCEMHSPSPNRPGSHSNTRYYVSYVPPAAGLGHAEIELLLRAAATDAEGSGIARVRSCSQAVLVIAGCMTPLTEIPQLEVCQSGNGIKRYPPNRHSREFWTPSAMDRVCVPYILYRTPDLIQRSIQELKTKSFPSENELNLYLRRTCRYATYARIKSYLLYTGPDFWDYSPVLPAVSYYGRGHNPGVFASYVHLDAAITSTLEQLYRFIDPTYIQPMECSWPGYGCPHVPLRDCVREFVQRWKNIPSITLQSRTLSKLIQMLNGYTAGMHLFCCILCSGTRNYPGASPANAESLDSFFINKEKGPPMLVTWPKLLRECLKIYSVIERCLLNLSTQEGCVTTLHPRAEAYSFYEFVPEAKRLLRLDVSPSRIVAALEHCPPVSAFSELHPNALRAFGMTELYSSGKFHNHEIEAFYGRTISSLNSLQVHRLEPATIEDIRRRIEVYFRTLLSL